MRRPRAGRSRPTNLAARVGLALLVAALLAGVAPAARAAAELTLTPSSGPSGTTVTASGTGFADGPITLWWDATSLVGSGTAVAGAFAIKFSVPAASDGAHVVRACEGSFCVPQQYAEATFTVGQATPVPTRSARPSPTASPKPSTTPGGSPTPSPTGSPTASGSPGASYSPGAGGSPAVSPGPSGLAGSSPTPFPSVVGPGLPVPSIPLGQGPSSPPTPYPALVASLAPQPPDDLAASPGPFPDLDVLAIEVTQGIQDLNNNMPLVAARRTYARVYLDVIGQNELAHTYGALLAERNGQQIGWIWPENGPITALANGGNRLDLDDSLYFRLPASWLQGTVKLTAFVYSHDVTFPWTKEPAWQNNFESETVVFHEGEPLDLHLVTVHLHRSYHPGDIVREYTASLGGPMFATENALDLSRILAGLWRYHPISSLVTDVFPAPIYPLDHASQDEWNIGYCSTTVLPDDPDYAGLILADWHGFMDDPEFSPSEGQTVFPDNDLLVIMDTTYEVNHFYVRSGGRAQVFGYPQGGTGPEPVPGAPAYHVGCPNPDDQSASVNSTVALYRIFYDWADSREFFVGMIDDRHVSPWAGLASSLDTAWVQMNPDTLNEPWYYRGSATMAHEVAHLTGLNHVACKDADHDGVADEIAGGPIDPTHPQQLRFPACSLAEVRDYGYYGFDVYFDSYGLAEPIVISNDPDAPSENRAYPLLSYLHPRWIDPYHYCRLLAYYGVPCDADGLDEPWVPPGGDQPDGYWQPHRDDGNLPTPEDPLLLLTGRIDTADGHADVRGLISLDDPTQPVLSQLARQGDVPDDEVIGRLVARDDTGRIVADLAIPREFLDGDGYGSENLHEFDLVLPLDPSITTIDVEVDGVPRAGLVVSQHAPTARWTSLQPVAGEPAPEIGPDTVVTWEAFDADADRLTATLLYSQDGEHWQVVGTGIRGGSHRLGEAATALPGSEIGRLRLLVSDGIHTTTAAGEPAVHVPNGAPLVAITAPVVELTVPSGSQVILQGSAFDREDRALEDDAFAWSSSLDGDLGSGPEIRTRELSAGRHAITLTVTDSSGSAASAAIELVVDGSIVAPRPSARLTAAVDQLFAALSAGREPAAPSAATVAGVPAWLIGILIVLGMLVVGIAAGGWYRGRATRRGDGGGITG